MIKLWFSQGCCHCLSWLAGFKNAFTKHVRLLFVSAVVRDGECVCSGINVAAPGLSGPPTTGPFTLFMISGQQATLREWTERVDSSGGLAISLGEGGGEGRTSRPVAGEQEGREDADRG